MEQTKNDNIIDSFADLKNIPLPDISNQSYVVDAKENIRGSWLIKDSPIPKKRCSNISTLVETFQKGVSLAGDEPCLGWRKTPKSPYQWISYNETWENCRAIGQGISCVEDLQPGAESCVCIYSGNRPEWTITEYGCFMYNLVIVPLYDTQGIEAMRHILNQTQAKVVVCDVPERARFLISERHTLPHLRRIIVIAPEIDAELFAKLRQNGQQAAASGNSSSSTTAMQEAAATNGSGEKTDRRDSLQRPPPLHVNTYAEIQELGRKNMKDMPTVQPNDLALICYTSGTTGIPKGVMLSHENCISSVGAFTVYYDMMKKGKAVHLSYLPLAHVFEQGAQAFMLGMGSQIGFFSGNVRNLLADLQELKPTVFCAVPRVLVRIYDKFMAEISTSTVKWLAYSAAKYMKLTYIKYGINSNNTIWDRFIFRPLQDKFGGRLEVLLSGGAALPPEVMEFTRVAFGCLVLEGYGATETAGPVLSTLMYEYNTNLIGPPSPNSHVKLADVPDMQLCALRDNMGEICIRGPSCTSGYYKDPERTRELIDKDGWLHTGDIGMWLPNGALRIVDRCKHIFKLSQGEYVAPERIEAVYAMSIYVEQVFVDGQPLEAFPVALVVPDIDGVLQALPKLEESIEAAIVDLLESWGDDNNDNNNNNSNNSYKESNATHNSQQPNEGVRQRKGRSSTVKSTTSSRSDRRRTISQEVPHVADLKRRLVCASVDANKMIEDDIKRLGKEHNLKGFEQVSNIYLVPESFSVDNGLLTPTLKSCRAAIRKRYAAEMNALYTGKTTC